MHAHALTKQSEAPVDEQLRAATTSRVPFGAYDAFATFENALKVAASPKSQAHDISRKATSYRSPRDSDKYPSFRTMPRSDGGGGNTALKAEAARRNDAIRAPYRAPSDQRLRLDSPATSWLAEDTDFQAKFVLPSNQDLRRRTALDQEGFFGPAQGEDLLPVSIRFQQSFDQQLQCRTPNRLQPAEFKSRVPHTARKSANIELRLEKILDQEGLLPELQEIRSHKYRDEASATTTFDTKFKPVASYKPLAHPHTALVDEESSRRSSPSRQRSPVRNSSST
ncbi:hypothetical protein Gpo141_00003691 [Globisporangium polare]